MGLVVSRFRAPDAVALLPELRGRTEGLLGRRVSIEVLPAIDHLRVDGVAVDVVARARVLEVRVGSAARAQRSVVRSRVRRAMLALGARRAAHWRFDRYVFSAEPPRADAIAHAAGATIVHCSLPWAVLRSGLRTPVEVVTDEGGFELQAPIFIVGRLHGCALAAAKELAELVPLGA